MAKKTKGSKTKDLTSGTANPEQWLLSLLGGGPTVAGIPVSPDRALANPTVAACVRILADDVAKLWSQLVLYQGTRRGQVRNEVKSHPGLDVLRSVPNEWMTPYDYWRFHQMNYLLEGNHYDVMVRNGRGELIDLIPIPRNRVTIFQAVDGSLFYGVARGTTHEKAELENFPLMIPSEYILHDRGPSRDTIYGMSVIGWCRESIGLALAGEDHASRTFSAGARPSGIVQHPKRLSEAGQKRLVAQFEDLRGQAGTMRTILLEEGMDFKPTTMNNRDVQFIECSVVGTMLTMANGSRKPVESIRAGDVLMGWENDRLVPAQVAHVGVRPKKPLVTVRTARGREITTTADHPFLSLRALLTPGGRPINAPAHWVMAGDLRIGNYVRVALGSLHDLDAEDICSDSWFLGVMTGNGHLRTKGCSFSHGEPAVATATDAYLSARGASLTKVTEYGYYVRTGRHESSEVWRLLSESGLIDEHSATKRVPPSVMSGGPRAWRGFLSGYLDADGTVAKKTAVQPMASWSSVNRVLLEDCQHLLALLGIQSGIYQLSPGGKRHVFGRDLVAAPCWNLAVCGRATLRRLAWLLKLEHPEKRERLYFYRDLVDSRYRAENFQYDRVVSVDSAGDGETIGIEVDRIHTHITNGLVTHNSRKFQVEEIARIFGVPRTKIGDVENSRSNNIEQIEQEYVNTTLLAHLERIECLLNVRLLSAEERQTMFFEFDLTSLVRGDMKTRYESYAMGRQWGWLSVNDIRQAENMNPVPDGDERLQPVNMVPLGTPPGPHTEDTAPGTTAPNTTPPGATNTPKPKPEPEPRGVRRRLNGNGSAAH